MYLETAGVYDIRDVYCMSMVYIFTILELFYIMLFEYRHL